MVNTTKKAPEGVDVYTDDGSWFQARVLGIDVVGSGPTQEEALKRLKWALKGSIESGSLTPEQTTLVNKVLPQLPEP